MDQKWKFQAPQFVAFNNLGANENSTADEFFNVDIENGEHRVETLVETTKVKDGKGQTRPTITIPEPLKLCTKFIAGEREQFELMKRRKEAVAEEERRLEEERKIKEEQDYIIKTRKALVHKAQPIRN